MKPMTEHDTQPWPAPLAEGPLDATVTIPGSKSLSNRFLILAALSTQPVHIRGLLCSRDTELMIGALRALGVTCTQNDDDATDVTLILAALSTQPVHIRGLLCSRDTELMIGALRALGVTCTQNDDDATDVTITPPTDGVFHGDTDVYCGLAGTVMRFVPPLVLFANGPVRFDGDEQAYARPMKPLLDGLCRLGAHVEYHREEGHLPFTVTPPTTLESNRRPVVKIDSSASSQFISGLLLAASRLPNGLTLRHTGRKLPSLPHIRMTMEDINAAGGAVEMPQRGEWTVEPSNRVHWRWLRKSPSSRTCRTLRRSWVPP